MLAEILNFQGANPILGMGSFSYLYLILIAIMMFSLPIIGIVGIYKYIFLRKNMWMFIPVSILDALFSYLLTDWLTINLLVHGSEYSWWGFQLLWYGRILVVNISVILITLFICLVKRFGKKAEDKKTAEGEEL